MGMPASARRWTAAEVRAMQDESRPAPRFELIDGELIVTPSPRGVHQMAVFRLMRALDDYLEIEVIGVAVMSPADIELADESVAQPDVFVVPAALAGPPLEWTNVRSLLLAIEVLSPSSVRHDRVTKRKFYQRMRVPEYWVVDLDARRVERWRPDDSEAEAVETVLEWRPAGSRAPLTLDLAALFTRVLG
jgi:Uma2 family endonuclease